MGNFEGEIAALVAAALWAVASVVYGRVGAYVPPLHLNLIKGIVAIALLVTTIAITGELSFRFAGIPFGLLFLSGVIGIGLGDTAFLAAINHLGARRVLLIGTLAPPVTAILAFIFLDESINASAWCGVLLTILGVAWVISEATGDVTSQGSNLETEATLDVKIEAIPSIAQTTNSTSTHKASSFWRGIGFAFLATVTNAFGAVLSRAALASTSINPLWAALVRLSAATVFLLPLIIWQQKRTSLTLVYWKSWQVILATCFAAFCGTYLGIWLQQTAIKLTVAGVASTLLQTSPIFILPLAILTGEKVTFRATAGVVIAVAGIALLFYLK